MSASRWDLVLSASWSFRSAGAQGTPKGIAAGAAIPFALFFLVIF
ncbi:MAG: hypothetical protein ACI9HK_005756, partial [Pirellulaceae bacterium]